VHASGARPRFVTLSVSSSSVRTHGSRSRQRAACAGSPTEAHGTDGLRERWLCETAPTYSASAREWDNASECGCVRWGVCRSPTALAHRGECNHVFNLEANVRFNRPVVHEGTSLRAGGRAGGCARRKSDECVREGAASSHVEQRDARMVGALLGETESTVDPRDDREHAGDNDFRLSTVRRSIRE